ncbi:ParB/RepB/Spo0J family partition protein [Halovulum sp. GXIMD14793]
MAKNEKKGLGRGLSMLLAEGEGTARPPGDRQIPIEQIVPNPDQPRRDFVKSDLDDLARSISEKGVIQPLIVRASPDGSDTYQIVAGERRWRAAQQAKLHELPVIIREFSDVEVLEIAIIENIQRADLNPVEEAVGYRQLMDRFGHTQEKISEALGRSRSHIANLLRLLNLPKDVLDLVRNGQLSAGHARTLVTAEDPLTLAHKIITEGLSVRQAEALAKGKPTQQRAGQTRSEKDADTRAIEKDLAAHLGLKISIDHKPGTEGGTVRISYSSLDQLDGLCQLLSS